MRRSRKPVYPKGYREFESLPLRFRFFARRNCQRLLMLRCGVLVGTLQVYQSVGLGWLGVAPCVPATLSTCLSVVSSRYSVVEAYGSTSNQAPYPSSTSRFNSFPLATAGCPTGVFNHRRYDSSVEAARNEFSEFLAYDSLERKHSSLSCVSSHQFELCQNQSRDDPDRRK